MGPVRSKARKDAGGRWRKFGPSALVLMAVLGAVQSSEAHRLVDTPRSPRSADEPLPGDALARAGARLVARQDFDHWFRAVAGRQPPTPGSPRHARLRRETMRFLVRAAWVELEAREHRIKVASAAVRRSFRRGRREAFRNEREYRRFRKNSTLTRKDLLYRVRLDMLYDRIARHLTRAARGRAGKRRALDRFARDFRRKWRARTVCARGYMVADCSKEAPVPSLS